METGGADHVAVYQPAALQAAPPYCLCWRCCVLLCTAVYCCVLLCTAVYCCVLHSWCTLRVYCRVEACVMERLAGYPSIAQQQLQRTAVWLPRRLGLLLQIDPQQVSAAVAAFMTR
jgi:hypothetical protein